MKPGEIEDVYELTPIQEGMLFHTLLEPGSGVYLEQLNFTVRGWLDPDAFGAAWQTLADRHPVLRTSFHWTEGGKALQVVRPHVTVPVEYEDWRDATPPEQEQRHLARLRAQRESGFDLARPPLMRVVLVRLADDEHRFFWSFPHLAMDGWSFGVALGEFTALYGAYAQGVEITLPAARPYRDYVGWWKRRDHAVDERFWRAQLAGHEPAGALEIGPRPAAVPDDEPVHGFVTDASLGGVVRDLEPVARRHRTTVNTVVQGAWMILLSRYLHRDDVVSGATSTHRPTDLPGAGTIVGPMLATIPVRSHVDPDRRLVDWLRELQSSMAEAREHHGVPLHLFERWAQVPAGTPLFETDLAFENAPAPDMGLHGTEMLDFGYEGRPHYPLTMVVFPQEDLPPRLVYDRRRFSPEAAERLMGHYGTLLRDIAADADRTVGEVEMLDPAERARLITGWNETVDVPASPCLHERFDEQAARVPDKVAVSCGADALTYAELDRRANRLAGHLHELGVGRGGRVGLCLERSVDTLVGILGVLRSGAAYVPVEPDAPAERARYVLRDAGAALVVAHGPTVGRCPHGVDVVRLDDAAVVARDPNAPEIDSDPEDLAYVLYTSGSTGSPKGVQVTHANVVRLVLGAAQLLELEAEDVWSMFHSYAFDVSVFEAWGAFLHGARLVVVPAEAARSPEALHELLRREGVTVLSQTPSAFRVLAEADAQAREPAAALRYVVFAGEYLDVPSLAPWCARRGDERPRLVNMYGITETTVHSTFHRITLDELDSPVRSTIGRPLPDTRVYVLDQHGRPAPVGVTGEIHVGGPGVTRGYQNLAGPTAERFLPDPFVDDPQARVYRSGDLARFLESGDLESIGRADFQIKIRGFRVEPGEVEAVLRAASGVRDAVVVAHPHGGGDMRLTAYVVSDGDLGGLSHDLREHCRTTLPDYMVPARVELLDELPLTPNGKIDRAALSTPGVDRPDIGVAFVAPRTPLEETIASVLREVLEVDRVGVDDDFADLGGHSLLVVRVVNRLRAVLGTEIPVRTFLTLRTAARLAEHVGAAPTPLEDGPALTRRARVPYREGPSGTPT